MSSLHVKFYLIVTSAPKLPRKEVQSELGELDVTDRDWPVLLVIHFNVNYLAKEKVNTRN